MVIYPTLASLSATKDFNGYSNSLIKGFNLINIIMIPAAVGVFLLREPIIMLYLKRGAFGEKEVIMTSNILVYYVPSMAAYGIRELLNRGLYSLGNNKVPVINSFINIIINFILCIIFIFPLKAAGLALANSLAVLISNIFLFISISKKLQNFSYNKVFVPTAKIIISAFIMGIVVYSLNKYILIFPIKEAVRNLISLIICGLFGSFIYFSVLYLLKIDKAVNLKNLIKKKS
jgi:putative peptidoglycan lipid II flippase